MKGLIDLVPALLFLGILLKFGILPATAALIPALFVAAAAHWWIDKKIPKMQLWVAFIALVLGGATLLLRDAMFIKVKPTVVYSAFAIILFGSRYIGSKPLLQRIPQDVLQMPDAIWDRIHLAWAGFFLFCAALNVYMFQNYSDEVWGVYKTFGVSIMMFIFMLGHIPFLYKYLPDEDADQETKTPTHENGAA